MIDWSILSKKYGKAGAGEKFEKLALYYVQDVYSEYTWIATDKIGDNNRDAHLGEGVEYDIWEEAKYKGKNYKIRRQDLDTTILSGIINGRVRMIIFVSNALIPEQLYDRVYITSKMKGIEVTFALESQLESWLILNPDVYKDIFDEEIHETSKKEMIHEIRKIYIYDTSTTDFSILPTNTELLIGEKYILYVSIYSTHVGHATLNINNSFPFFILEDENFDRNDNIVINEGITNLSFLVQANKEFCNCISIRINIDGKPFFGTTQHILIQPTYTLPIVYSSQLKQINDIEKVIKPLTNVSATYIITVFAESGMGKSYLLRSIYLDYIFKRDIVKIDFERSEINNLNYMLLCKIILYMNFGNIFLFSNTNSKSERNMLKTVLNVSSLGNSLSNSDLDELIEGCAHVENAMRIVNKLLAQSQRNNQNIIISNINSKINKLLLLDDVQFLNTSQQAMIKLLCDQAKIIKKNITIILVGTKGKFKNNNQERSFVELTTNQFQLSGLSYDDKVKSITNIAPNVLDGSLDIIDAIIPNNPLLAHEIIQNLFVLNKVSNLMDFITNYNSCVDGNIILEDKFTSCISLFNILDIIYLFKLGVSYNAIVVFFSNDSIKTDIQFLEKNRLIHRANSVLKPFHDIYIAAYKKLRKGKIFNKNTGLFLEFLLSYNKCVDRNLILSYLIRCGKQFFIKHKEEINNIITTNIHNTNFGIALYYCEYYYHSLKNRKNKKYTKKELYFLYLYADCLVHCGRNGEAEEKFQWICKITDSESFEHIESGVSLLNQWFWHNKFENIIADSYLLQKKAESLLKTGLHGERLFRIRKAIDSCYNRRMVTQLILEFYDDAKTTYKIRAKRIKEIHQESNIKNVLSTLIMDYARGTTYVNISKSLRLMKIAQKFFRMNIELQYRRFLLCNIDYQVMLCISSYTFNEKEIKEEIQKLKQGGFYSEYFKSILKYYACKIVCESYCLYNNGIKSSHSSTIDKAQNAIHNCLIDINLTPTFREKYLYNILMAYIYIVNNKYDDAKNCLIDARSFMSNAGESHLRSICHNIDNVYSITRIRWCVNTEELYKDCYYLDSRYW